MTRLSQLHDAVHERFKIAELRVGSNRTRDFVLALIASSPVNRHIDEFAVATDVRDDTLDQTSDHLFSVNVRGLCCSPEGRYVGGQRLDASPFPQRSIGATFHV